MILPTGAQRRHFLAVMAFLLGLGLFTGNAPAQTIIGRITDVEGQLFVYVPAQSNWVPTVRDAPFGLTDAVYTNPDSRAEIVLPNDVGLRLGPSSQAQLVSATPSQAVFSETAGVARFATKVGGAGVQVTTPFGYVEARPGASFDVYVGAQSIEVLALAGDVRFVHARDNTPYTVVAGGASLVANATEIGPGDGAVDPAWADWNRSRDNYWAALTGKPAASARYLPRALRSDAPVLDRNGRWEQVPYKGREVLMWRPTSVAPDWAPFTAGRWVEWNGDTTWVPEESFGYVTHHYGSWVFVDNAWYWLPPQPSQPEPNWYPGRVAWVGSADSVGWVPLAPDEPYYAHRRWGPEAVVVAGVAAAATAITIAALVNVNHAIIVPQRDFHGVDSYSRFRARHVDRTVLIHDFRSSTVVNNTVVNNYTTNTNRFSFTTGATQPKPAGPKPPQTPLGAQTAGGTKAGLPVPPAAAKTGPLAPAKPIPQTATPVTTAGTKTQPAGPAGQPSALVGPRPTHGTPAPGKAGPGATPPKPGTTPPGATSPASPTAPPAPGARTAPATTPQATGLVGPRTPGGAATPQTPSQGQTPPKPGTTPPGATSPASPTAPPATGARTAPATTPQATGLVGPRTPGGAATPQTPSQGQTSPRPGTTPPGATSPAKPTSPAPAQNPPRMTTPGTPPHAAVQTSAPTGPSQTSQEQQRKAQEQLRQQQTQQQQLEQQRRVQEQTRQQQMQQQQMEQQRRMQEQAKQQQMEQQRRLQEQARQQQMQQQSHQSPPQQKSEELRRMCQQHPNDPRCK